MIHTSTRKSTSMESKAGQIRWSDKRTLTNIEYQGVTNKRKMNKIRKYFQIIAVLLFAAE